MASLRSGKPDSAGSAGSGSDHAGSAGRSAPDPAPLARFAHVPVALVAVVVVAALTALSGRYGYHRDELYFMVAGQHPDWGYVDQPPLTPLVARATTALFGEGTAGLRVAATLACAATIHVVALTARETGAGRRAQTLAACCAAISSLVLVSGHMLSTTTFDLLAWLVICWLFLRLLRTGDGRWWVAVGAVTGIGLQNKYLVILVVAVLLAGLVITGPRTPLRSRWLPVGAVVALALALPNVWWQATHGWPQLTVAGGISSDDGAENRALFVPMQLVLLSPLLVPFCVVGWLRLWRHPGLLWARSITVAYPLLAILVLLLGGKPYYAVPLLAVLMATGCEPVRRWARHGRGGNERAERERKGQRRSLLVVAALALSGAMNAVVALPVLPANWLSVPMMANAEQGEQVGWPELADAVAAGWSRVPERERHRAVILTSNYGEAGALARYGPERGLPTAYSGHMSFADWGPPPDAADGPVLLVHQQDSGELRSHFSGCRGVARVDNNLGLDNEEQDARVVLCTGKAAPWSDLWPDLRRYY